MPKLQRKSNPVKLKRRGKREFWQLATRIEFDGTEADIMNALNNCDVPIAQFIKDAIRCHTNAKRLQALIEKLERLQAGVKAVPDEPVDPVVVEPNLDDSQDSGEPVAWGMSLISLED